MSKSIVLLSGGLDSAVCSYYARQDSELFALTFDYGQRHRREVQSAIAIATKLSVSDHQILELPLKFLGSSLLDGSPLPEGEITELPNTWIPQRNSIFLAIAFGYAEVVKANSVYIGVTASLYPDAQPSYIHAIEQALNQASKQFVEEQRRIYIETPLEGLNKAQVVKMGLKLGVDFSLTTSCYRGEVLACGKCPPCVARLKAFKELGLEDPIAYERK